MHKVPTDRREMRVIDPDQVCDATAVLADSERVHQAATVLDALGEVNRLSILLALRHAGDLCVSDLAVAVGMSDSAVSHALRLLRAHGMVTAHREGRLVRYRIAGGLAKRILDVVSEEAVGPVRLHAHGAGGVDPRHGDGAGGVDPRHGDGAGGVDPRHGDGAGGVDPRHGDGAGGVDPGHGEPDD